MDRPLSNLEAFLTQKGQARSATIEAKTRLTAGAIQENWLLSVWFDGGPLNGVQELVLRSDAPAAIGNSRSRAEEFALLRLAHQGGVRVPHPLFLCTDLEVTGRPFFIMRKISGIADARLITRDQRSDAQRRELLVQLGQELAVIHRLKPNADSVSFLQETWGHPATNVIKRCRAALDALPQPAPALEWGLRWAELNLPKSQKKVLCHRDFRTGNLMIDGNQLTGILDWEFADWSDPMEDIGWFCAKCWRFGFDDQEAGGIGPRDAFYAGYEGAGGKKVDPLSVRFWEVMAHIRWAIIAREQGERFATHGERALEPAMTAFIAPQLEWEVMQMTGETH